MKSLDTLLMSCRAGFEAECAAEATHVCSAAGLAGYARANANTGWASFQLYEPLNGEERAALLQYPWVFPRMITAGAGWLTDLDPADRLSPVLGLLAEFPAAAKLECGWPDTNEGRGVGAFCRKFQKVLDQAVSRGDIAVQKKSPWGMQLFFEDSSRVFPGLFFLENHRWPQGIARLKLSSGIPSRSAYKLEEALQTLLPGPVRDFFRPGMTAVDLGAAPGGWSWVLAHYGLKVTGVDNGQLDAHLLGDNDLAGRVTHVRGDAFRFEPARPVDWVVCDVVDVPAKVADRLLLWLRRGWARQAVFNLKLPMKKRYREVQQILEHIEDELTGSGREWWLRCKHLYHDREEVTVVIMPLS